MTIRPGRAWTRALILALMSCATAAGAKTVAPPGLVPATSRPARDPASAGTTLADIAVADLHHAWMSLERLLQQR